MSDTNARATRFFARFVRWRWVILVLALGMIIGTGSFLPKLERDTTSDAFINPNSSALIYKDKMEDVFGLTDPIIIAVVASQPDGIYSPEGLALVERLTEAAQSLPQIDPDRVTSLATENNIVGVSDGMVTEGFFERNSELFLAPVGTAARGEEIKAAIADFPLLQGSLVARDGSVTIIVLELLDQDHAVDGYAAVLDLVANVDLPESLTVHVAGEGAVSGYLSSYIDEDARKLNPLAGVIITLVLIVAFMSLRAAILPNVIVMATVVGSFGLMAASGTNFFVITNGLVVNLIGIAVADSIHIISEFYTRLRKDPDADKNVIVAQTMAAMWRPVTLTTLTTIAGFLALAFSSIMPPIFYFGLFGALGVLLAWIYSMTLLPALLAIWPSRRLPRPFRPSSDGNAPAPNRTERMMTALGRQVLSAPKRVLAAASIVLVVAGIGASQIVVDEARINNFKPSEPIYQADKSINAAMDGIYNLDILIETDEPESLFRPDILRKIEALQTYTESLPHVNGSTSIVDYIKQLHRAVNEGNPDYYSIPDDAALVGQLFFLYGASADPADFEEEVDFDYQRALVRAQLDTGRYTNNQLVVPALENWILENFNGEGVKATVTGRVTVDYYWLQGVDRSTLLSILLSFCAVTAMSMLVFRSFVAGAIAALPVGLAVLCVYAVMGYFSIPLGIGTSMFAAIAIGLSIDFSIHALDRLREIVRSHGFGPDSLIELYPTTGRALLFNFIAVAGGFGVLATSDVPPLVKFGSLVAVAVSVAFLSSVTVLPALVAVLKPKALMRGRNSETLHGTSNP